MTAKSVLACPGAHAPAPPPCYATVFKAISTGLRIHFFMGYINLWCDHFGATHFVAGPFWSGPFWREFHDNNFFSNF